MGRRRVMGLDFNATSPQIAAPVLAGAMWLMFCGPEPPSTCVLQYS